eukprot:1324925-Rhodomonas_salina.2
MTGKNLKCCNKLSDTARSHSVVSGLQIPGEPGDEWGFVTFSRGVSGRRARECKFVIETAQTLTTRAFREIKQDNASSVQTVRHWGSFAFDFAPCAAETAF